jgi:hypothetical protein
VSTAHNLNYAVVTVQRFAECREASVAGAGRRMHWRSLLVKCLRGVFVRCGSADLGSELFREQYLGSELFREQSGSLCGSAMAAGMCWYARLA